MNPYTDPDYDDTPLPGTCPEYWLNRPDPSTYGTPEFTPNARRELEALIARMDARDVGREENDA